MSSKVHFHGGPIAFFDCTEPAGKFFHRFSNFNQSWGAFLPNQPFFEIISSSLSKGCLICLHILSSWSYSRSNNPKDYCLVILEATGLFRCSVAVWFLSENLKQDYWYGSLQHLKWRLRKARAFLSFHGAKCFKSLYKLLHRSFVPLLLEIIFSYFLFCVTFSVIMFDNCLIWFRKNHY